MQFRKLLTRLSGALAVTAMVGGSAWAASTPIEHVVVIFQENVSFDHYFGTYPVAKNTPGDGTLFTAKKDTPSVNGLSGFLLANNPNFDNTLGKPFRLSHADAATCDQDHDYTDEQKAFDLGLMDLFSKVDVSACSTLGGFDGSRGHPDLVMGYYDGNTVTALWNYAQNFAMNDNSYSTTFGPSTPGALNLISGNTSGAIQDVEPTGGFIDITAGSVTGDGQPFGDTCTSRDSLHMTGKNIGDLLNTANLTWGWFQGGFDLTITNTKTNTTKCKRSTSSITGAFSPKVDYIPHHEPFQYYASTSNPAHTRPTSTASVGSTDAANHQYDSHDFLDALKAGKLPSVVFLKAAGYQDGHAGYSSPLDEQAFFVDIINKLQSSKFWSSTAVIIAYDDSDGWYDHQMSPIVMHSQQATDALTGPNQCGGAATGLQGQGRCGFGPRQPFMVISPWAKTNFVDSTLTDLSSVIRFIEDDFGTGRIGGTQMSGGSFVGSTDQFAGTLMNMFDFTQKRGQVNTHKLFLDPTTGQVLRKAPKDT